MEVRPSRRIHATFRVAVLGAMIAAAWAVGRYGDDPARLVAAPGTHAVARGDPRVASAAPRLLRPTRRSLHVPAVATAAPRTKAAIERPRQVSAIEQRSERRQAAPKRTRTVSDEPPDAPLLQPFKDPPPPEPPSIAGVAAIASSSTVRVTWQTNFPATGQGADALGTTPVVWTAADPTLMPSAFTHETVFSGLEPATTYHFWIRATDEWGRTATVDLSATTGAAVLGPTPASVNGSTIFVAGQPFFPIALWEECTNFAPARIALGINLFIREGCGHEDRLAASLQGRAYAVVDAQSGIANQPGVIGWYYQDELDGRQSAPLTAADVNRMAITPPAGLLTFLTLTNHFYSGADPLSFGRSVYPAFAGLANVVSFDLYPLQEWCQSNRFGDVYDAQRELATLANYKPTFQWIEVRQMKCPGALNPTPQTVAAETWLSIAGGATGIGYFPHDWSPAIGDEIRSIDQRIVELKPALLAANVGATADAPIKVGARSLNGALYVIAVNSGQTAVDGAIRIDGGGTRTFDVLGEGRQVVATDGVIKDSFAPLDVHIYVSAPMEWSAGYLPP